MRRTLLVLPLLLALAPPPAEAQYIWDLESEACGLYTCANLFLHANGRQLTGHIVNHGGPIVAFDIDGPGVYAGGDGGVVDGKDAYAGWVYFGAVSGSPTFAGATSLAFDGYYLPDGGIMHRAFFGATLEEPVPYWNAYLSGHLTGLYPVEYAADDPACGPGGWYEGDPLGCPGYEAEVAELDGGFVRVTPEPASLALLATGLVGLALLRRRRKA